MKKFAISLIIGASLIITPSAFALKAMTDSNMKEATGQAGVSIALDDITLYQTVGDSMYIDTDGVSTDPAVNDAGAIIQSGVATLTTLRGIVDHTNRNGFLKTAFDITPTDNTDDDGYAKILDGTGIDGVGVKTGGIEIAALSIDVAAACTTMAALDQGDVPGVVIGLPTLEICKTGSTKTVEFAAYDAANDTVSGETELIRITKTDSVMAILGGTLEIAAH